MEKHGVLTYGIEDGNVLPIDTDIPFNQGIEAEEDLLLLVEEIQLEHHLIKGTVEKAQEEAEKLAAKVVGVEFRSQIAPTDPSNEGGSGGGSAS
ncbi:hypothetical protein GCM10009742_24730 [Kribbella karoonensis]|uniref:Uncharacterized protein n=2 Tax=Kribbella karoonensis TaxID=324851 RepID=A0ABN2DKK6_9ACTN